ncbi:MAG: membrane lipoprotein lipid attachment site-containing protein, partial [Bacteroidales bacterium]|nr:membrane lipoprotein lipid attachment site-containing protein [Bacteroidales bacterium]
MKKIVFTLIATLLVSACINTGTSKVYRYYTATSWDRECPRIPLYEPLAIYQQPYVSDKWSIAFDDFLSNQRDKIDYSWIGGSVDSIHYIGADGGVVYGYVEEKYYASEIKYGKNGSISNKGFMYFSDDESPLSPNEVQMELVDSVNGIFLVPKRWYIINTNDTSFSFIFTESDYKRKLKDLNIS